MVRDYRSEGHHLMCGGSRYVTIGLRDTTLCVLSSSHVSLVYSESDDHSYCHHEILLTSFPLALEWMDFDPEQPDKKGACPINLWILVTFLILAGSYLAVGMMSPGIEVWDLDVVDGLEPVFTLTGGGHAYKVQGKGKKKKKVDHFTRLVFMVQ